MAQLTPSRRSALRAEAHKLKPVVIIGDKGLTDEVMAEIERSLKAHELIKVRALTAERDAREAWMDSICERLDAHAVQVIGKVLVIYRENFDKPREKKLDPRRRGDDAPKGARTGAGAASAKRTARPRSRTPSPRPESEPRRRRPRTSR